MSKPKILNLAEEIKQKLETKQLTKETYELCRDVLKELSFWQQRYDKWKKKFLNIEEQT